MSAEVARRHGYIALAICTALISVMSIAPAFASASSEGTLTTGLIVGGLAGGALGYAVGSGALGGTATNVGSAADTMCNQRCAQQQQMANAQHNNALNCFPVGTTKIPCTTSVTGLGTAVSGQCMLNQGCKAITATGLGGGGGNSLTSLAQLGMSIGQLLMALNAQQAAQAQPTTGTTGTSCTSYTPTSDPTQIGINPCVYYVPATTCNDPNASNFGATGTCSYGGTTGSSSASDLLNALTGGSGGNTSSGGTLSASPASGASPMQVTFTTSPIDSTQAYEVDPGDGGTPISLSSNGCFAGISSTCVFGGSYTYNTAGTFSASLEDQNGSAVASASISVTNPGGGLTQAFQDVGSLLAGTTSALTGTQSSSNFPGVFGNLFTDQNGATIFASTINPQNNSQISGFYGSSGTLGQSEGFAGQLCQNRPWASNFLANIIPPTFFDGLCQWRGYQVGTPPPATAQTQVTLSQTQPAPTQTTTTTAATTTPSIPAQVQIWAEPASVPLGVRTSVFWNTQGVTSCNETSPDGSFSENSSLSGAAATVPLTGATTFTISCIDPNGNPITDYVTVNIN